MALTKSTISPFTGTGYTSQQHFYVQSGDALKSHKRRDPFSASFSSVLRRRLVAAPLPLTEAALRQALRRYRAHVANHLVSTGGLAIPDFGSAEILRQACCGFSCELPLGPP